LLNPLEMERYVAATAKRADIDVVWEDGGVPRCQGDKMFLPSLRATMTPAEYKVLQHEVGHEVRHQLYSDLHMAEVVNPEKSLLGAIWNHLEDHRVDYLDAEKYEGDRLISDEVHGLYGRQLATAIHQAPAKDEKANYMLPLLSMVEGAYKDIYPSTHLTHGEFTEETQRRPEAKKLFDKMVAGKYDDVLRNIRQIEDKKEGSKASLELAKRIFEEVYGGDAEKEMQRLKQEAKGKGAGKGDKQEGKEDKSSGEGKEGEGEGEGKAAAGSKQGKGEPSDDKEKGPPVTVDWSEMCSNNKPSKSMRGQHLNYDKYDGSRQYIPCAKNGYEVTNYTDGSLKRLLRTGYDSDIQSALATTSAAFAHKVRTVLQVRARDRYHYGKKQGKLHGSSLYRVTMDKAEGFNERVFKQKEVNNILDAAVCVLVDQSGSMSGDKYANAAAAGIMLNDTIGNALHIPLEVVGFTTPEHSYKDGCGLYVHRTYNNKLVSRDDILKRFDDASDNMGNNPDGDAIMWVFDRLMKRPEKRKLIIVCSDGSPAGGGKGDVYWYTKKVVQAIEQESPVDIVGIGIQDSNVTRIYKENYVIKEASQLETALLSVIEKKLK
jgi:cobaltochelatase CobT